MKLPPRSRAVGTEPSEWAKQEARKIAGTCMHISGHRTSPCNENNGFCSLCLKANEIALALDAAHLAGGDGVPPT